MSKAVLVKSRGEVEVVFQSEETEVYVFDLDSEDLYLYRNNLLCRVLSVSPSDGTITLRCVDTIDGTSTNRSFIGVDPSEVDLYEAGDIDNYDADEISDIEMY